uniref:(northern house mosquito) hypothetical protein n=1 Tax=Culex pipiens TaxID=7175 RepID=A0A8D8B143_CULPI
MRSWPATPFWAPHWTRCIAASLHQSTRSTAHISPFRTPCTSSAWRCTFRWVSPGTARTPCPAGHRSSSGKRSCPVPVLLLPVRSGRPAPRRSTSGPEWARTGRLS